MLAILRLRMMSFLNAPGASFTFLPASLRLILIIVRMIEPYYQAEYEMTIGSG
jgi:hypothetical protein